MLWLHHCTTSALCSKIDYNLLQPGQETAEQSLLTLRLPGLGQASRKFLRSWDLIYFLTDFNSWFSPASSRFLQLLPIFSIVTSECKWTFGYIWVCLFYPQFEQLGRFKNTLKLRSGTPLSHKNNHCNLNSLFLPIPIQNRCTRQSSQHVQWSFFFRPLLNKGIFLEKQHAQACQRLWKRGATTSSHCAKGAPK